MTITVNTPDGGTAQFPDGTPPDAMTAALKQKFGGPAAQDDGKDFGALFAALHGAADTATFGLADRASAAMASGFSHLTGNPLSYDEAYARVKQNAAASAGANPLSNVVGQAGGVVAGGGLISGAAKALKAAPLVGPAATAVGDAMALKNGAPYANTLKSAAVGAGFGATDAAGHGGDTDQVGMSAATGAVFGPVLGKVATATIKVLSPAATKAMSLLADKIGESANTLERAFQNFHAATGRVPTMAELVGLKSSGELRQVAANNPLVGEAATQAADAAHAARPSTLPAQIERVTGQPAQDVNALVTARSDRMTAAMRPIRNDPVHVDQSNVTPLYDPRVRAATNGDPALRAKVAQAVQEVEDNGSTDLLTTNDIDSIRKSVRGRQSAYANPQATIHNPHTAESYGELAHDITGLATGRNATHPYAQALSQFEEDTHYIKGFKHGMAGKDIGEAADQSLIRSLNEPAGQQGYASGVQSRLATEARSSESGALSTADKLSQRAGTQDQVRDALGPQVSASLRAAGAAETTAADRLSTIAPGAPNPTTKPSLQQAAQAGAAAIGHSPAGIAFHITRAIPGLSKSMSPAVQMKVAQYLLDPTMTQQGINLLRKAGATNADIRRLALAISANVGANSGEALSGGQ